MNKSANISTRINASDKKRAEVVFKKLGITASQAISMFYKQVHLRKGIPFPVEIPNEVTQSAIQDAREGKLRTYHSIEDMKAELSS